jgi:hypothetical protein
VDGKFLDYDTEDSMGLAELLRVAIDAGPMAHPAQIRCRLATTLWPFVQENKDKFPDVYPQVS